MKTKEERIIENMILYISIFVAILMACLGIENDLTWMWVVPLVYIVVFVIANYTGKKK